MGLKVTEPELTKLLESVPFARPYGFKVSGIADGRCRIEVAFKPSFERPGGIVSGQTFMAAADVAMWFAIKTRLGLDDASVTAEMKTNFLSAAKQEPFSCEATILKLGRRLVYGVAECTSQKGVLLAHHTITYIRP